MNKNPTLNASGCKDLTAYKALNHVRREERRAAAKSKPKTKSAQEPPKVFICSPYAGDVAANEVKALKYCRFAVQKGKLPVAPHCYFPRFMDDCNPAEREMGIAFGVRLLYECREMWIFGSRISDGMKKEILAAKWRNIRIRHFTEDLEEAPHGTTT